MMQLLLVALSAAVVGILFASLAGWIRIIRRLVEGHPALPLEPRPVVPWSPIDIFFLLLVYTVLQAIAIVALRKLFPRPPDQALEETLLQPPVYWVGLAANLVWVVAALWGLRTFRRASWRDLGFRQTWRADIGLGIQAFVLLAPVVYVLQFLLVQLWPSHHPLVDALRERPEPQMLLVGAAMAVLVAPIFEELAIRLVLQGGLEHFAVRLAWQSRTEASDIEPMPEGPFAEQPSPDPPRQLAEDNPYAPPATDTPAPPMPHAETWLLSDKLPAIWRVIPILISATVFSALHFTHGPDWIPLFFLALGLGYIYQRTGRILPCIIVHFLINAVSYSVLLAELWS